MSIADLAITMLSAAELAIPENMGGTALLARDAQSPAPPYAETLYGYEGLRWAQMFALRLGDRKLIVPVVIG